MRTNLEFKATHQHPTLGELTISILVDADGGLRLHNIQFQQKTITNHELVSRNNYTVYFSSADGYADFIQWKNPWNGTHGADAVKGEPFVAALNVFAKSATLRRIMRRKLDAGLRALTVARRTLS